MKSFQLIAVDDENLALDLLENYIERTPNLVLSGRFQLATEALQSMRNNPPDILLLDIQMPGLSGLNLLRSLARPPVTIFTTAYPEYGVDAFDLDVVDYLLKPFAYERFLRAIAKAAELCRPVKQQLSESSTFISVKVEGQIRKVNIAEISHLEGMREYVRIHTTSGKYLTLERMHRLAELLPKDQFIRVHKSYLVARKFIHALAGNQVEVAGQWLPISRSRKQEVTQAIFGDIS